MFGKSGKATKWIVAVTIMLLAAITLAGCTKTPATTKTTDVAAIATQQWSASGHANAATAKAESGSTNCARCHTEQGFMTWIKQDMTLPLQGAKGTATAAELAAIVTPDNARPQTCSVCHVANNDVRFNGDTNPLPSGYQAKEVGKGAICITCHNTRNGAHGDTFAITAYSAPHQAAQGDVLMGQNAFFVPTQRSPHSFIQDTCVTCHMEKSAPAADLNLPVDGINHTFKPDINMCKDCHSATLNGKALQAGTEDKIAALNAKLGAYMMKTLTGQITVKEQTPHTFNNKSYDVLSSATVISRDNIVAMAPIEVHGQQGFTITLKTPVTFTYAPAGESTHTTSVTSCQVAMGNFTSDGTKALIPFSDPVVKAGWNYYLIEGDASLGIHNPTWATDVLNASIAALK